jgi:tRNA nucleotidyltransferase (CCA-adding enzyme)
MKIYLVGGAVRDTLLGYPFHERDWVVVGARAEELLALGYQPVGKDFPVFLHPDSKEEYALARTERKTAAGYTGFDCYASPEVTLEQDLQRRDLSINAMAQDDDGSIIDPYGGQQDLANKLLRHVSPAFTEDPLRVLRVARFSARYSHLGFTVAEQTLTLMRDIATSGELQSLPAERVWKELERALTERSPGQFFTTLEEAGALAQLMPELCQLSATAKNALTHAAAQGVSSRIRFSLLFVALEKTAAKKLCQRIKAPNEFRDLALLVSQYAAACNQQNNPEQLLSLIENCDAIRRPQRFSEFLSSCALLFKQPETCAQLPQALAACIRVNAAELAAQGLKGRAIATALRQKRLAAISTHIELNT